MDEKQEENQTKLQKIARHCQYGVIGTLEKFFEWYGTLIATYPLYAILISITVTFLGGLGLFRFYEEGDAASMVIPRHSTFRRNIDWLDENFPREIRTHSILYQAENVLTPEVFQTMYRQRKLLQNLTSGDKSFQDLCIRVPVLKLPTGGVAACRARKTENEVDKDKTTDPWDLDMTDDFTPFWEASNNATDGRSKREVEQQPGVFSSLYDYYWSSDVNINHLEQFSNTFYPDLYCGCVELAEKACYEQNILELWGDQGAYTEVTDSRMRTLTQEEILETINTKNVSGIFMKDFNFIDLLGNIRYGDDGRIIGAGVVEMKFYTTVNVTDVRVHGTATRGEKIDVESYTFEGEMVKLLQNRTDFADGISSLTNIQRQFFDSFVGQTFKDADKLAGGYILVFLYVNLMLSQTNFVQQRFWLSVVGILSVAMGMILGYGLCSMFGLFYSAAHTVIPFLLLGIGIDNIFVITQTFKTLESTSSPAKLSVRFGQTMKHAGVAVSVTTFTDVIAFFVGTNTLLPGLQSFCVYAAVSIFTIYALQVTHFVAWFSLDQRRQAAKKDGCLCCIVHNNFKPEQTTKKSVLNVIFGKVGNILTYTVVQVSVILLTVVFFAIGLWGMLSLTQEYQPEWLLPADSEVAKWFEVKNSLYPSFGEPGYVFIKQINISEEFHKFDTLIQKLTASDQAWNINNVQPWHLGFRDYVTKFKNTDESFEELIKDESFFRIKLTQFLYSPRGAIYQPYFWWSSPLTCGQPAPDVLLQAIPYSHLRFNSSSVWIPAMRETQRIVSEIPWTNDSFTMALTYINWETDAIVGIELLQNVGIAIICIFITTLITLGSWRGSLFVMMCVLLTCVDIAGFMHWWGITIEITSMNIVIISVGLCVDYCAHIVHGFLTTPGTRKAKILFIMENIAPAVVNGGFSTMLALSLLVTSRSHVFISFFKIFLMICLFGLFHGLIMLPVILCLFGPVDIVKEDDQKPNQSSETNEIFSLKFIRTLLSEKYFKHVDRREMETIKEMETFKTNGVTENLLESKVVDEENQNKASS